MHCDEEIAERSIAIEGERHPTLSEGQGGRGRAEQSVHRMGTCACLPIEVTGSEDPRQPELAIYCFHMLDVDDEKKMSRDSGRQHVTALQRKFVESRADGVPALPLIHVSHLVS